MHHWILLNILYPVNSVYGFIMCTNGIQRVPQFHMSARSVGSEINRVSTKQPTTARYGCNYRRRFSYNITKCNGIETHQYSRKVEGLVSTRLQVSHTMC